MVKRIFKMAALLVMAVIFLGVIWFAKPYEKEWFVRLDGLVEVSTQYAGWACGDGSPQLTPYRISAKGEYEYIAEPFILFLAPGVLNPEESVAAVAGNDFILWGYREKRITKNILTGRESEQLTSRIYVVGWKVDLPYRTYSASGDAEQGLKPLYYYSKEVDLALTTFTKTHQVPS